ncbi:hypothetical protein NDU88_003662 [Pleurodeles waltl]|uniref:Lamina-associated polypeptide 2 alpha C-terminal domain-containing protein n=1 Tax=Pleurodeles waltl TaxID=8319 RepID=A0AAV7UD99_PLEWA|nr:hypothetical protein NDU88_003662 [Pleurodeles waltl]
MAASPSSTSCDEGPALEKLTGKYIRKDQFPGLVRHVKVNMGFQVRRFMRLLLLPFYTYFKIQVDVSIHACIKEVMQQEWRDLDKILLPHFMAKLYLLHDMQADFSDSILVNTFVASLVGNTSLAEDAVLMDPVDKKVDGSLSKVYSGVHLALQAGIYGTDVAQSLISILNSLCRALDKSSHYPGILELIERHVEFLSDISFDVIRASALTEGACVPANRNLVLRDWKTDAAPVLKLQFQGSLLIGPELESRLQTFQEK